MNTPAVNAEVKQTLVIACGALAHELVEVLDANRWSQIEVQCLPAHWHNTPDKITPGVEQKIIENQEQFDNIIVAYGDCGTGGKLDRMLEKYDVERLPGDHCYSFYSGDDVFKQLAHDEIGTFYLTDYLAWHFDRLILEDLGIKKHPELRDMYFGNYTKMVYLAQTHNDARLKDAQAAAESLQLPLTVHNTGLQPFEQSLRGIKIVAH